MTKSESPIISGPIQTSVEFAPDWDVAPDGKLWSRPMGSTCSISFSEADATISVPPNLTCVIRFAISFGEPGRAVGLIITMSNLVLEDQIVFPGSEHEVKFTLVPRSPMPCTIHFRAYDPRDPRLRERVVTGRPPHTLASWPPAVSVLALAVVRQCHRDHYKAALIAAGYATSMALFPTEAHSNAWWNAIQLADILGTAITARTPFSMVRLGDGEGRLLAYPWLLSEIETAEETVGYMFGTKAMNELVQTFGSQGLSHAVVTLQRLVAQAVRNADCLGIPAPTHFQRFFDMPDGADRDSRRNGVLGMAGAVIGGARYFSHLPADRLFDTYIFKSLFLYRLFDRFLTRLQFVGLISHTDLTAEIAERFQVRTVAHLRVPGHHSFMHSPEVHFPSYYEYVIEKITVPFTGAVFLVAAGYLGKAYCDVVKLRGGIAIDIGSIFDGWCGSGRDEMANDRRFALKKSDT